MTTRNVPDIPSVEDLAQAMNHAQTLMAQGRAPLIVLSGGAAAEYLAAMKSANGSAAKLGQNGRRHVRDSPFNELPPGVPISVTGRLSVTAATYTTIAEFQVPQKQAAWLNEIAFTSNNFALAQWRLLLVNASPVWDDRLFSTSLSIPFRNAVLDGAELVRLQMRSDGATAIVGEASITLSQFTPPAV